MGFFAHACRKLEADRLPHYLHPIGAHSVTQGALAGTLGRYHAIIYTLAKPGWMGRYHIGDHSHVWHISFENVSQQVQGDVVDDRMDGDDQVRCFGVEQSDG